MSRKTGPVAKVVAAVLGLIFVGVMYGNIQDAKQERQARAATPAKVITQSPEERKAQEERVLKAAVEKAMKEDRIARTRAVIRAIKGNMNDPKSFELVSAIYMDDDSVCVEYRGKNAFNATILDHTAVSKTGKVGDWNKLCGGKSGIDHTRSARYGT